MPQERDQLEIQAVWDRYLRGRADQDRNLLMENYLPLVQAIAGRLWARLPKEIELDDLISAGTFGLVDALKSFDPARGTKFATFMQRRVRGAMLDELRKLDWVPRLVRKRATRLKTAGEELARQLGRQPTVKELARQLKLKVAEVERMQRETEPVGFISLDKKWFETDSFKDVQQIHLMVDRRGEDPQGPTQERDVLRILLRSLNRQDRLLVIGYYWEGLTMREIGRQLGLSESRVSQRHSQILAELQRRLASRQAEIAA